MSDQATGKLDIMLENELLTNEVRRLRGELTDVREQLARVRRRVKALESAQPTGKPKGAGTNERLLKRQAQALEDMQWLVGRLDRSPVGPVLRTRTGFRTLKSRYGQPQG